MTALNGDVCSALKIQERTQIYQALGIDALNGLRKKVLSSIGPDKFSKLKEAAAVPAVNPFFFSEAANAADQASRDRFSRVSAQVVNELGTQIDGIIYKRFDVASPDAPIVRIQGMIDNGTRQTILFQKPSFEVARNFSHPESLKIKGTEGYDNVIAVIQDKSFLSPDPVITARSHDSFDPYVKVIFVKGNQQSELSLSDLVAQNLPPNCRQFKSMDEEQAFNSVEKDVRMALTQSSKSRQGSSSSTSNEVARASAATGRATAAQ